MLISLHEVKFISVKVFLKYITCKIKQEAKETIYKSYTTNCLKSIVGNTAKMGGGSIIKKSYDEIIKKIEKTDIYSREIQKQKTVDEIAADIIAKGGLKLIDNTRKGENKE